VSMYGAPPCGICGAHSDYCTLDTASGIQIDCRDLQLKNPDDLAWNIELARELRSVTIRDEATEAEHDE
jgi:hypothetical protein